MFLKKMQFSHLQVFYKDGRCLVFIVIVSLFLNAVDSAVTSDDELRDLFNILKHDLANSRDYPLYDIGRKQQRQLHVKNKKTELTKEQKHYLDLLIRKKLIEPLKILHLTSSRLRYSFIWKHKRNKKNRTA